MAPTSTCLTLVCLTLLISGLNAQQKNLYSYQELSHFYYQKQKDSLKKTWDCPTIYKDKETQRKYKEMWDSRTAFIADAIAGDHYVRDAEVYNYVQEIISQIVTANKETISVKPFLLIDRSASVNAYAVGGNIIAVNLGLISFSQSREELALAIAHELSHNVLNHSENAMKQRAEMLTSDEYKKSLNAVLDSKYERVTRLRKVLENYSFNRSKHQRYHESDADSLAIMLLKKANIAFNAAYFLRLDSADTQYKQALKKPVREYFTSYSVPFEEAWTQKRSKGLSTRNYNFKDTTARLQDSLKTHPDCKERYEKTLAQSTGGAKTTAIPAMVKEKAAKMLIWNMYNNMNLTPCLYRILLEKDNGSTDDWYDFMIHNIFTGLYYADKELRRFNAIGVTQKENVSKDYYELQTMLEQIPREQLEQYCKTFQRAGFWNNMAPAEKSLKNLMFALALDPDYTDQTIARAAKDYIANNSASMYCEFAGIFEKK
jgi:Zn-dependent protease with chaperone function